MNNLSVYERIKSNIGEDGKLPNTFSLEPKHTPNQIRFMPGAMDGIGVFHIGRNKNLEKFSKKIVILLKKFFKTGNSKFTNKIESLLDENRAISLIDPILNEIRTNHKGIDANRLTALTLNLIKTSENTELLKIGIGLLGLLDLGTNDEMIEVVTTLALYDDFTLYSVVAALNWTGGNDIVFAIAKHVDGWGKIHAVERLESEKPEIREWILYSGCSNNIMDSYLGLTCAVKGDLISALRQNTLSEDLFESVSIIIRALLDEGPVPGISEYEHAQEALSLYVRHALHLSSNVKHLWYILNLLDWIQSANIDWKNDIKEQCDKIIHSPNWRELLIETVKEHNDDNLFYACDVAVRLKIDITSELFNVVKSEPIKYYPYIPQLLKNSNIASELITLYEVVLPLNKMAEGMGDYLFSNTLNQEHHCLDFILPELAVFPMQGTKLITAGLNSRVTRERNMALRALAGWVKMLGKSLSEISPEINAELYKIYETEVNKNTKKIMKSLIDGESVEFKYE